MEKYKIESNNNVSKNIVLGRFVNLINGKHKKKYGDDSACQTLDRVKNIFLDSLNQIDDLSKTNNLLLVGKVQSGKTSNLEMLAALAFDNGYNILVVYGGYDNTLLSQTTGRFKSTFEIESEDDDDKPLLLSTETEGIRNLNSLNNSIFEDLIEMNRPIIIVSLKRPEALKKVNAVLNRLDPMKVKAYIIDDEGDQASLNTAKDKVKDKSSTYARIVDMKKILNNPLYYSVTATPHANIFLDDFSELRPETVRLIEPGEGYCGGETYHLANSSVIEPIDPDDTNVLDNGKIPSSLVEALNHFVLGSCIMKIRDEKKTDMIIHCYRNKNSHQLIYTLVEAYRENLEKDLADDDTKMYRLIELKKSYDNLFDDKVKQEIPFDVLEDYLLTVVKRIRVILKNSDGDKTQGLFSLINHKIYIGGDLLQRGVTFDKLITTYYTRWAQSGGNMDTNLQRARWFGYREAYIDICKIFTTKEISEQYSLLTDIEMDLWEQFYMVQKGDAKLADMIISAENTKMKPTRQGIVNIRKLYFSRNWMKQRLGNFDSNSINENNTVINEFIGKFDWNNTSAGRTNNDGEKTAKYIEVEPDKVVNLMNNIHNIFQHSPFDLEYLHKILLEEKTVYIILMNDKNGMGRERSFYSDNIINNIHQGPDKSDTNKRKYNGDTSVIIDNNKINIQIHKIVPKKNKQRKEEYVQYMFAIYIPYSKQYYVQKDE